MNKYSLVLTWLGALLVFSCQLNGNKYHSKTIKTVSGKVISTEQLEGFINKGMQKHKIPGLSLAVINDGKIVHVIRKGVSNKEKNIAVTNETIFEGASLSKPLFGFFVMTLIEDGSLELDRPLYQYLPYQDIAYDERYKQITTRMVLAHTSGFPNWRSDFKESKLFIQFKPGTQFFYSGEAYQYLAKVVAHILNTDAKGLETEFQRRVASKASMGNSQFIPNIALLKEKALPYKAGQFLESPEFKGEFGAAYSIHTEAVDYANWLIAIMNREILSDASYAEYLKPQSIPLPKDDPALALGWKDWALGFSYYEIPQPVYFHGGNNYGFTSIAGFNDTNKWGLALFTNADQANDFQIELMMYLK